MDQASVFPILGAIGAIVVIALTGQMLRSGSGIGGLAVRSRELMTRRERIVCNFIERAVPAARVHAQVSIGAILQPAKGLNRSKATSVRNLFSSKRIDFLLEDRGSGEIIAIVELDDRTHNARADAQRDRMTARAGYRTVRLCGGRHTQQSVTSTLHEALALPGRNRSTPTQHRKGDTRWAGTTRK